MKFLFALQMFTYSFSKIPIFIPMRCRVSINFLEMDFSSRIHTHNRIQYIECNILYRDRLYTIQFDFHWFESVIMLPWIGFRFRCYLTNAKSPRSNESNFVYIFIFYVIAIFVFYFLFIFSLSIGFLFNIMKMAEWTVWNECYCYSIVYGIEMATTDHEIYFLSIHPFILL